jgi:hypothetical protein
MSTEPRPDTENQGRSSSGVRRHIPGAETMYHGSDVVLQFLGMGARVTAPANEPMASGYLVQVFGC